MASNEEPLNQEPGKEPENQWKIGDEVRLKHGGVAMTVNEVGTDKKGPYVICVWLKSRERKEGRFHPDTLIKYTRPAIGAKTTRT